MNIRSDSKSILRFSGFFNKLMDIPKKKKYSSVPSIREDPVKEWKIEYIYFSTRINHFESRKLNFNLYFHQTWSRKYIYKT